MRKTAYLVPSFHHDIVYLRPEAEYTRGCFMILDEALNILNENPEYCFFIEQAWLLEKYWDARPEKRALMKSLAGEGRFAVEPGLYAVPDMNMPDGESIYMQATIGKRIVRETIGTEPRVAMITDCWGHHGQLPQILRDCGYAYYAFSRCMRRDVDRQNFVWHGVDGSEIRTHWMSTHYDGVGFPAKGAIENKDELQWVDAGIEGIGKLMKLNSEKCGDDAQYLPSGGDMRLPSAAAPMMVKKLNKSQNDFELVFSLPEKALEAVDWGKAVHALGEFQSAQQGSFTTNIRIKQADRQLSARIFTLEMLNCILDKNEDFTLAWKMHLKNQFHDTLCGTVCDGGIRDIEADFVTAGHLLDEIKRNLTKDIGETAYFNALPFETQVFENGALLKVPPMGFAPVSAFVKTQKREEALALPLRFENAWYIAEIDKDGYISSLIEKKSGRELTGKAVHEGGKVPFGALTMQTDYGDSWWAISIPKIDRSNQGYAMNPPDGLFRSDVPTYFPRISEAKVIYADSDRIVIEQKGEVRFWMSAVQFTTAVTLSLSDRKIAYHTEFLNTSKNIRLRAAFPVNGLNVCRHQIPYALVKREAGEQAVQMFTDASCEEAGLALINRGIPANNIEDGVMLLTLFRAAAMEYKTQSELSFNLGKKIELDYAVCPHASGEDDALWQEAYKFNYPCVKCIMPGQYRSFSVKGAYVSALRKTEDGAFLRIYNPTDEKKRVTISVPGDAGKVFYTNGLGEEKGNAGSVSGEYTLTLNAYTVQGLKIK